MNWHVDNVVWVAPLIFLAVILCASIFWALEKKFEAWNNNHINHG